MSYTVKKIISDSLQQVNLEDIPYEEPVETVEIKDMREAKPLKEQTARRSAEPEGIEKPKFVQFSSTPDKKSKSNNKSKSKPTAVVEQDVEEEVEEEVEEKEVEKPVDEKKSVVKNTKKNSLFGNIEDNGPSVIKEESLLSKNSIGNFIMYGGILSVAGFLLL